VATASPPHAGTAALVWDLLRSDAKVRSLALALLGTDAVLALTHVLVHVLVISPAHGEVNEGITWFLFTRDGSYPEIFGYVQAVSVSCMLACVWLRTREFVFLVWAIVFAVVFLDDSLQIHERCGVMFAGLFGLPAFPGLRSRDTGELLTWTLLGAALIGPLVVGFLRCSPAHRRANAIIGALFAALLFFAVVVDMLQIAAANVLPWHVQGIQFIEDGGEMLAISLLCVFVFLLSRHPAALSAPAPRAAAAGAGAGAGRRTGAGGLTPPRGTIGGTIIPRSRATTPVAAAVGDAGPEPGRGG
jgi:hypothetical protein